METMTEHDKDLILSIVKHYMKQDLRRTIMLEVPQAYNNWVGRDVVEVHRVSDGKIL